MPVPCPFFLFFGAIIFIPLLSHYPSLPGSASLPPYSFLARAEVYSTRNARDRAAVNWPANFASSAAAAALAFSNSASRSPPTSSLKKKSDFEAA
jgi:hypothetical protein